MRSVLISGASGMLGKAIASALRAKNLELISLVRRASHGPNELEWKPEAGSITNRAALEGIDAAIHLSGASLTGKRWTKAYKRTLIESRVTSTRLLAETLAGLQRKPAVLISASAIGFYGNRGDEVLDEDSARGNGFLAELCEAWERSADPARDAGIRVVHLRFGVVLSRHGGALAKMLPLFKAGLGGKLGNGRQWMSWVSEADVVGAALFALNLEGRGADLAGALNVVAPQAVINAQFTRELAYTLHRKAWLPAPAPALRLVFGEMANEALLSSARVVPARLIGAGYHFRHPRLSDALHEVLTALD
jgi:hypothetical protein